jgi:Kdo2-lipid IVA lauroyltransferase/acyltransferase
MKGGVKAALEYAGARSLLAFFGAVPRRTAFLAAELVSWLGFHLAKRQRLAGLQNLRMAMPELSDTERVAIIRGVFSNLGRLLVEFAKFPDLKATNIADRVSYEGFENFTQAASLGKGVIFLTAHLGAWELSSFAHSIYGHPMKFVVRSIDNPRVEELISEYRTMGGNVPIHRRNAAREILKALRANETVGILVDQNTTRAEGVFVNFFGIPAATTTSVATFALRTGAAVVPGFLIWDKTTRKHKLHFDPPLDLIRTSDAAKDVVENTQRFNEVVESYVRRYPDQWLWIHRRWKTRPEGEEKKANASA